jgi:hypothetical protein
MARLAIENVYLIEYTSTGSDPVSAGNRQIGEHY